MKRIRWIYTVFISVLVLSMCSIRVPLFAQPDATTHLRISLLTVGVGDEIYASFGHTGIRVTDSVAGTDIVYNWGTFDGFQKDFEIKFMRGKLLYYASSEPYAHFFGTYVEEQRGVEEQVIHLSNAQEKTVDSFLKENIREENRYYKYDFLYDNCATRQRNIFPAVFGAGFRWGTALQPGARRTFRDDIDHYLRYLPWERFGIDLLLGSPIDKVMSNTDAMFLPDYLRNGLTNATVNGQHISEPPVRILPEAPTPPNPANGPLILCLCWGALIVIGTAIPGVKPLGDISGSVLLVVTGLLGCLMVFMWLGTDHQACRNNFNVLWCLPTNLIIPFVKREKRSRYAIIALIAIGIALVLHVLRIQALPLRDCWPLIVALIAVYGMIYRSATAPPPDESDAHHHH